MSTTHAADELLEAYVVSDRTAVEAILRRSPTVAETLAEAASRLATIFGGGKLHLAIRPDPDSPGHAPIVVSIHATGNVAEALAKLDRFDREWWLKASTMEPAEICFLIEPE